MKKIVDLAKDIFASKEQTAAMVLVHNVDGTHMAACGDKACKERGGMTYQ